MTKSTADVHVCRIVELRARGRTGGVKSLQWTDVAVCPTRINMNDDNPFAEPVEIPITDSLDLHSFSPKEIRDVVEAYLIEAHKKGFRIVRIIHGKGVGIQRETVRNVLAETDFVESFKNAPEFSGSWGATIAIFKD